MNKIILMGRLTRDPEIRYSQGSNPMAIARYTLAVDKKRKRDGVLAVLCIFLAAACGFDYRKGRIPNALILLMAVAGAMVRCREEGVGGILAFLAGGLPVMLLLYPFFRVGALGAGDVKLFGVTAGFLPFEKILFFSFFSLLIAAIFSVLKLWKKRCGRERLRILLGYLAEFAGSGKLRAYPGSAGEMTTVTVRLSGPVLFSVLLFLGGVY